MKVFLTGSAGFIGFHTALRLLEEGYEVFGYDNINDYYNLRYKYMRLEILKSHNRFYFHKGHLEDEQTLKECWMRFDPTHVIHLAAQAGVRYSIENPKAYIQSNIVGFQNIIDLVRETKPQNFVYASSSSVYGGNKELPFTETQNIASPISLYATTKIANELVAKTYGHLFGIPSTGLRFFTVYGPYGRPDMAMFKFTENMLKGEPIPVFNHGKMVRDFTFVDDIVDGIYASMLKPEMNQVYNLGRGKKEYLIDMIKILEECVGKKAIMDYLPMQPGDVEETSADVSRAAKNLQYQPKVAISEGIPRFVEWYLSTNS